MIFNVARDAVIFCILGLILGFLVDFLFVDPDPYEYLFETIFYILMQVIICAVIVYCIGQAYEAYFGFDPDTYFGLTMFIVIFFLVQVQLFERVALLFEKITGRSFPQH